MIRTSLSTLTLMLLTAAAAPPTALQTPAEVVAQASAGEWRAIPASDLMVMELLPDARGLARRIVIQLMPAPYGVRHVANIKALAEAHWWDGTSINRVQDNYVVQWGDATEKKALPAGLATVPESDYVTSSAAIAAAGGAQRTPVQNWQSRDSYARWVGIDRGWPTAGDGGERWPTHCYGMIGVGRDLSPNTGTGAELYAVIGHATRQLDRNIAVVGRVIAGIEHLSSLPRGTGSLGFYESAPERVPILSVRLASEMPESARPRFEYLSSESGSFTRYVELRANRKDSFYFRPAGGVDICNIVPPVRAIKK